MGSKEGDSLWPGQPVPGREGLLIALTLAQAPINVLGSSLSPASLRCALPRLLPGPVLHLGCFPGIPVGHRRVLGVGAEAQ